MPSRDQKTPLEGWRASAESTGQLTRCSICLEMIAIDSDTCPECDEPLSAPASSRAPNSYGSLNGGALSIPDLAPDTGWLKAHWRPLVTFTMVGALVGSGIMLRHVAPAPFEHAELVAPPPAPAAPTCDGCWHCAACQMGVCVWQSPNDVGHVTSDLTIAGPFDLPEDVVDVEPLDAERYAVSYLKGVQIHNARTGGVLSLVSDAPHAQHLFRAGDVVYATSPHRIYVIDAQTTTVLKTIEMGSPVAELAAGASGQRVLASMPSARAVAVIATDYHAEVARFYFGDEHVRAIAIDDTGKRALTTNGHVPLAGLNPAREAVRYGGMFAFDPSRLPSEQDQVRTGLVGNPVDIVMMPDSRTSFVVLREEDSIVRLERLESGAVRQHHRMTTCRQPEQLELIRNGRRGIVRCNAGHAIELIDLEHNELIRHVPLNGRVSDMAVSPDGKQAVLVIPHDGSGVIGMLDLESYELSLHEVNAEPHRVELTPDGKVAVVVSDRSKVAWVVR